MLDKGLTVGETAAAYDQLVLAARGTQRPDAGESPLTRFAAAPDGGATTAAAIGTPENQAAMEWIRASWLSCVEAEKQTRIGRATIHRAAGRTKESKIYFDDPERGCRLVNPKWLAGYNKKFTGKRSDAGGQPPPPGPAARVTPAPPVIEGWRCRNCKKEHPSGESPQHCEGCGKFDRYGDQFDPITRRRAG